MQKLEEVSEYVLNYLEKRYNMDKKKLIVNSDGGIWIDSFVRELGIYKPIHIYDKFHLVKAIAEISKGTRKYQKIFTGGLRKITLQNLKIFMRISRKKRM